MPASAKKREREDLDDFIDPAINFLVVDDDDVAGEKSQPQADSPSAASAGAGTASGPGGTSSNFRNVSACNRCRHRKNRCDQRLPRCSACVKANALCVGFDPVSKREIPRSYVYYLETRLRNLETLLVANNIPVPPPEQDFSISEEIRPGINVPFPPLEEDGKLGKATSRAASRGEATAREAKGVFAIDPALHELDEVRRMGKVDGGKKGTMAMLAPPQRDPQQKFVPHSMATPGISFSKVVMAAVRSSVSQSPSERGGVRPSKTPLTNANGASSAHDSFFGLYTKTNYKSATFPDVETGKQLVELYFEYANPQIPVLHRGDFMAMFEKVYAKPAAERSARELYLLQIVFAVGSGIIMDGTHTSRRNSPTEDPPEPPNKKRLRTTRQQFQDQPEEYHAAAVVHLQHFLSTPTAMEGHGGGLEELQAALLLAALALLRPVAPGLWYIVGVAVRLAVDLGLHFEEGDPELDALEVRTELLDEKVLPNDDLGKKQWTRDLRRRLWWCVYSFDRLVSTCVGRPFGITDQVVTTEFPSLLEDQYITKKGLLKPSDVPTTPTYKLVSHHYFRLRLLQSEILQVLQYRQAQQARALGANAGNVFMHTRLPSPFLDRFKSFREWRADVDSRLYEWKEGAPTQADIGVSFTPLLLELNYWQAIIMLYRQSLSVPAPLAEELSASTGEEVHSPGTVGQELKQDEQQVFLKVAQAGQMVIKTYRQLHRLKLVNYTFLATHHLFMSGISFLYALWHSPLVRSQLTLDDVDFTILAATSVLTDLIDKCPPAEACRDAFTRMSKATITTCMNSTGFGNISNLGSLPVESPGAVFSPQSTISQPAGSVTSEAQPPTTTRSVPNFDMSLKGLFSDDEIAGKSQQNVSPVALHNMASHPSHHATYQISNTQPYAPLAESIAQAQPELSFDHLDFLDTFPVADPNQQYWGGGNELDLGFGTGGTGSAYDGSSNWDEPGASGHNGGVDLFDGFFFGGNGAGY